MLWKEASNNGGGVEAHLQWSAALDFQEKNGRWPAARSEKDAAELYELCKAISESNQKQDSAESPTVWSQTFTPPDYMTTFDKAWGVPRELNEKTVKR